MVHILLQIFGGRCGPLWALEVCFKVLVFNFFSKSHSAYRKKKIKKNKRNNSKGKCGLHIDPTKGKCGPLIDPTTFIYIYMATGTSAAPKKQYISLPITAGGQVYVVCRVR